MSLGGADACDLNVSLQRRLHDEMDTCAFTARALDDDGAHARRRSNAQQPPHEQRAPFDSERSERSPDMGWPSGPQSPYARAPESDAFPPAWAIVLAIAIALAALACFGKWK
jgi:hypothetical protein